MSTTTPNLGLTLPTPNVDTGWGSTLNTDFTLIDNLFSSAGTGTSIGINIGSGKTLLLGGTMLLGTGDNTGTVTSPTIRGPARTGTNALGTNIIIDASNGTGTAGSGNFTFRTAPADAAGTIAGTFQSAIVIGKSTDPYLIDIGAGGTSSSLGSAKVRANGSSAGIGSAGGSAFYIANNGTNAGAFGNRSTILAGTTAYDSSATVWGSSSIGFVVGSGTLAASNEKVRIGSAGQIYLWDSTLTTPALNAGTSGQVLSSGGPGSAAKWVDSGLKSGTYKNFGTGGISFTNLPSGVNTITLMVNNLDASGTSDAFIQLGTGSTPTYLATGYLGSASVVGGTISGNILNTTAFRVNCSGQPSSGTIRLNRINGNSWNCDYILGITSGTAGVFIGGGTVNLPAELTAVQIIPGGTDTFSTTGGANVLYM